jgi:hypothetical protein
MRGPVRAALAALALAGTLASTACSSLLDVDLPGRVPADALDNPDIAPTLVQGAIADFECGYTGYIGGTGMLAGEFITAAGWRNVNVWGGRIGDIRTYGTVGCATSTTTDNWGTYRPLQTARFQAEDAVTRIEAFADAAVPNKNSLLATALAYGGYSYTLLGEGFCTMAIDGGKEMQPAEVLAIAEARFTRAISLATAPADAAILNMARVGRARVRLDLGKKAEAAADARLVPAGFVRNATYSTATPRRENRVYAFNQANLFMSVHPSFRNLMVGTVPDTRVRVTSAGRAGHDGQTALWHQNKYTSLSAPIPIASWKEAQLIIAEAEGGQAAVDAINRLRTAASLPLFASTDPAAITAQVIEERRRELFAEGHRINDLLRLKIPFEQGSTHKGEPFGNVTCLPLPEVEVLNNPNITR